MPLERRVDVDKISRERLEAPPGEVYTETILEPGYTFMLEHYFYPLVETNKAWTVMLAETGIIDAATAAALLRAIFELETEGPEGMGQFDPNYEYFYSHMEHYLIEHGHTTPDTEFPLAEQGLVNFKTLRPR